MEIYNQTTDVPIIGKHVADFPNGIKEAFDELVEKFGQDRAYYGISWMDDSKKIVYYAMVRELFPGEGTPHRYKKMVIAKGEYLTETIHDWMSKTDSMKDVFHELMKNSTPDENSPAIEWYQSDEVVVCMVKVKD